MLSHPALDFEKSRCYNQVTFGPVAQLGAHYIRIVGVGSSNLLRSTKKESTPPGWTLSWYTGDSNSQMQLSQERCIRLARLPQFVFFPLNHFIIYTIIEA